MDKHARHRIAIFSVVPSPYQRDLFAALARLVDLRVFYLEAASPDSPWPEKPLANYERILPGFWFPIGSARVHVNWALPDVRDFDLVIVNTLMSITAQRLMRGRLRDVPWIFLGEKLARRGGLHERLCAPLHRASAIAAVGTWAQRDYAERFPEPRSYCLPYYCELAGFLAQARHTPGAEPVFLFCGQMIERKGIDVLLAAFSRLGRGRLVLIGRKAELPPLPERVEYAGFQPPEELPRWFAKADVFVLPSRHDGWGVVVNQAIAAGLPVICSDQVGAGHDLVTDGANGFKIPAGDADALLAAMRRFIDEPELITRFGEASRSRATEYAPEVGAAKWVAAIGEVLAR
ncbi:MAG: glycosyltransferase family 4 protein [Chthoniobacteraceae bacterium]